MAGLLHRNSTPAGFSCGRPHCVILLPGRAVAGRKYHYPCRDRRETVCHRLFYGQMKPLVIFAMILFPRGPKADESWRIYRCRFSHVREAAVNVFRLLDMKLSKNRREKEKKALTTNVGSEALYQKFSFVFFRHSSSELKIFLNYPLTTYVVFEAPCTDFF